MPVIDKLIKFWDFVWNDDSWLSWIVNIVLAFILIKFIVYPFLGLVFATDFPVVAVISGSMEHDGTFNEWWNSEAICGVNQCTQKEYYSAFGIDKNSFLDFSYSNGFNTGDIMILYGTETKNLKVGDILVFKTNRPDPIIHRIISVENQGDKVLFQTKGDHNVKSIKNRELDEVEISENQIIGKAIFRVPYLGYVKILFVELLNLIWRV